MTIDQRAVRLREFAIAREALWRRAWGQARYGFEFTLRGHYGRCARCRGGAHFVCSGWAGRRGPRHRPCPCPCPFSAVGRERTATASESEATA